MCGGGGERNISLHAHNSPVRQVLLSQSYSGKIKVQISRLSKVTEFRESPRFSLEPGLREVPLWTGKRRAAARRALALGRRSGQEVRATAQVDNLPGCHHSPEPRQRENEPRHQNQDPAGCRTTATTPVIPWPRNPTSCQLPSTSGSYASDGCGRGSKDSQRFSRTISTGGQWRIRGNLGPADEKHRRRYTALEAIE